MFKAIIPQAIAYMFNNILLSGARYFNINFDPFVRVVTLLYYIDKTNVVATRLNKVQLYVYVFICLTMRNWLVQRLYSEVAAATLSILAGILPTSPLFHNFAFRFILSNFFIRIRYESTENSYHKQNKQQGSLFCTTMQRQQYLFCLLQCVAIHSVPTYCNKYVKERRLRNYLHRRKLNLNANPIIILLSSYYGCFKMCACLLYYVYVLSGCSFNSEAIYSKAINILLHFCFLL